MNEKERFYYEDLFFKLMDNDITIINRSAILEEFAYITLDYLHEKKKNYKKYIDLLEHFETISLKNNKDDISGFFFALSYLLTLKYKYTKLPLETIDRKSHNEYIKNMVLKNG